MMIKFSVIFLGALPKEQGRFREVDKEFREIMSDINSNPRLVVLAQRKDLANLLKSMLDQLGRCQKALNELLEVRKYLSLLTLIFIKSV
jgi:dynein heavy chain 2